MTAPGDSWPPAALPNDLKGHRPRHAEGPTWCCDCGEFYFDEPCRKPGAGLFETADKIVALVYGEA